MPLHLLGKKSWNVYNNDNIARVRRDEAAAKAKEEEQELKWREEDANRRLQLLRGEEPPSIEQDNVPHHATPSQDSIDRRKRRRLTGEDDTDRDLRIARHGLPKANEVVSDKHHEEHFANLKDKKEGKSKDDIGPDVQGMRFKDAGGIKQGNGKPWYADTGLGQVDHNSQVGRDVWGNEDPQRREREQNRMTTNDPLLAMKQGIQRLRQNEKERQAWVQQRERDLNEVEDLARQHRRKRRHHRESDEDSIEDFSLDGGKKNRHKKDRPDVRGSSRRRHSDRHHRRRSASPRRRHDHHDVRQRSN